MKNTKKFLLISGAALAIALFCSSHISTTDTGSISATLSRHEFEIQKLKTDVEVLRRMIENLKK